MNDPSSPNTQLARVVQFARLWRMGMVRSVEEFQTREQMQNVSVDDLLDLIQQEIQLREEAHEVLEPLDCVVIGDPAHCAAKLKGYEAIGADRMMCLMQFGSIPHAAVLKSIELAGRYLVPAFASAEPAGN